MSALAATAAAAAPAGALFRPLSAEDGEQQPAEIESLCMNCFRNVRGPRGPGQWRPAGTGDSRGLQGPRESRRGAQRIRGEQEKDLWGRGESRAGVYGDWREEGSVGQRESRTGVLDWGAPGPAGAREESRTEVCRVTGRAGQGSVGLKG